MIVFRTDASEIIGTGHVFRCLALAQELKARGHEVVWIMRDHSKNLVSQIKGWGFRVETLAFNQSLVSSDDYSSWFGADWNTDAKETNDVLRRLQNGKKAEALIVDHYAASEAWERLLKPAVKKILVVDDLENRRHDCDLLLDSGLKSQQSYEHLLPQSCRRLIGPGYALLRDEFKKVRAHLKAKSGKVENLLVFFGGSDAQNNTLKFLKGHQMLGDCRLRVKVVLGKLHPNPHSVLDLGKNIEGLTVLSQTDRFALELAACDLFIGAAGVTTWERCCLGVPSMVVSLAENQVEQAKQAHEAGLLVYLGPADDMSPEGWQKAMLSNLSQVDQWIQQSERGLKTVDGKGVQRVVEELMS